MGMEKPTKADAGVNVQAESLSQLHEREITALREGRRLSEPSKEYVEGEEELNFHYTFSTGEVLSATEDDQGIARIIIRKGEEVVLDFQDLLPTEFYKFTTPRQHSWAPRADKGEWSNESFTVHVGHMKDPKSIALLLHEIGHIVDFQEREGKYKNKNTRELWREYTGVTTKNLQNIRNELAEEISTEERNAWANALKIARKIKQEKKVDLLEGFKDLDELRDGIYAGLLNYRMGIAEDMTISDEGLIKGMAMKIWQKLGFSKGEYGADQTKFTEGLFDKNRLKRGG